MNIEKIIIYTNEQCPYCKIVKEELTKNEIEFENRFTKDFMKLLLFNDPIPVLMTHNYGFQTATGRNIIETIKEYYYKYENLEL